MGLRFPSGSTRSFLEPWLGGNGDAGGDPEKGVCILDREIAFTLGRGAERGGSRHRAHPARSQSMDSPPRARHLSNLVVARAAEYHRLPDGFKRVGG